ncbi:phosphatase PAP2 family protein [Saccharothrix longispora]|uniref:phosphatase PAP2 family protein n=1 Tax=Saccharothrix longispora TaxID=33920 RepID=UPI0028FDB588|nr:phosphatase PAP2 family protein [Saccharothrix longispora]MDU0288726.1 phosphatase PAP2 family protein [Saccharothrix longispora]
MEVVIITQGSSPTGIEDVPDVMAEIYLETVEFANSAPAWIQELGLLFTEGSIVLLLALLLLTWWRARSGTAKTMASALLAPVGLVVSYLLSEWSKTFVEVDRPCRTLNVEVIAECPPVGDWSLPSNHATIAGAIAIGVLIAWPRLGLVSLPIGVLAAYSRVFVGVHYPHDVVVGFLMGATVTAIVMVLLVRPVTVLVGRLREHPRVGVLLAKATDPAQASAPVQRSATNHGLPAYYDNSRSSVHGDNDVPISDQSTRRIPRQK